MNKKNYLKTPDFYVQVVTTIIGILALSLGITLIVTIHSGYDPLDGFFAAIVAVVQHAFPNSGWDYTNGKYTSYIVWIFMLSIFIIDLLVLRKMKKLHNWTHIIQLCATLTYVYFSGFLVGMWSKVIGSGTTFSNYIEKLWSHDNYGMIILFGIISTLVLAFGVAIFIRGFLFQGPYNGFTLWGCISFKVEYKYMRIACDAATGVISIVLFLVVLPTSDYKSIFGFATLSPFFFGFIVEWIIKGYDKIFGKFAKLRL